MARETVYDYDSLLNALRARAAQLGVTRLGLDEAAGLPSGYVGKLLGPRTIRRIGARSLGPILSALGLRLIVEIDPCAKHVALEPRRQENLVRHRHRNKQTQEVENVQA